MPRYWATFCPRALEHMWVPEGYKISYIVQGNFLFWEILYHKLFGGNNQAINYLRGQFPGRVISSCCDEDWSARSPDLTVWFLDLKHLEPKRRCVSNEFGSTRRSNSTFRHQHGPKHDTESFSGYDSSRK